MRKFTNKNQNAAYDSSEAFKSPVDKRADSSAFILFTA